MAASFFQKLLVPTNQDGHENTNPEMEQSISKGKGIKSHNAVMLKEHKHTYSWTRMSKQATILMVKSADNNITGRCKTLYAVFKHGDKVLSYT